MTATWLADVLRAAGLRVDETIVPDWKKRGHPGSYEPRGVIAHHTAGARTGDLPSLRIVRDGRTGLPGPLSQLMLTRGGVWVPIAAGKAWHAGEGSAPWVPNNDGNRYLIGVEAESCGVIDDWTPAQREAYPRGVAALLRHMGVGADRVIGHKEWAPRRKVDPAYWDMREFRSEVGRHLAGETAPVSAGIHTVAPGDTLYGISRKYGTTVAAIQAANNLTGTTIVVGQVLRVGAAPLPPAPPTPVIVTRPNPGTFRWALPRGHYYGHKDGPVASHGGYNAAERDEVRNIQRWFIYHGCVPGVTDINSGWADGIWEDATTNACREWFRRFRPSQPKHDQIWADDYVVLARP